MTCREQLNMRLVGHLFKLSLKKFSLCRSFHVIEVELLMNKM